MTPELFQRAKEIFGEVCGLPAESQAGFLQQACGDDTELHEEVASLLSHHREPTILSDVVTNLSGGTETSGDDFSSVELPQPEDWVGRRLGDYVVIEILGSGGTGIVLKAHDPAIQRDVAIKVLHPLLANNPTIRQRFLAEARAAGKLSHPNIITIYGVASEGELDYLVMEFVTSGSVTNDLRHASDLRHESAEAVREATSRIAQACQGLTAAHEQGLVHRDIKPDNLLIAEGGIVKITDFGIAKLSVDADLGLTQEGQILGTPNYMSPEQCNGKVVDFRSDLYSLGATYYCLLTGKKPYEEADTLVSMIHAHCFAPPPDPRDIDSKVPAACAKIICRAMAKSPEDRYPSALAMQADLEAVLKGSAVEADASRPLPQLKQVRTSPASRRRMLLAAGALLALSVVAVPLLIRSSIENQPYETQESETQRLALLAKNNPIRVGILHSLTGTMAGSEAVAVDATLLAIEELNQQGGILGRPVEPIVVDGRSDERVFAREAQRLIKEEEVCTIFGCWTSASRKAVLPVVEQHDHLLIYPVNTEGVETSPNIIYLGGEPTQLFIPCIRWAYAFEGKRSFFLIGSDCVYPRVVNEMVKNHLDSMGATLAGEEYLPLGSTHVEEVVKKIMATQPDAIFNSSGSDTHAAFIRELRSQGITVPLFNTTIGEQELRRSDISQVVGDYSVCTYFQSIDTPSNRAFIERVHKKYGPQRVVNAAMEAAYAGVWLWAQAVEEADNLEPTAIRGAMLMQEYDAPGGPIRIDPKTQYAYRQSFIGQVQENGQFRVVWRSEGPVAPAPFPKTRSRAEWNTFLDNLYTGWGDQWSAPQ